MKLPRIVYAIQHNVTKKYYIGSSSNVRTRFQHHLACLRRGTHPVEDMQQDFDIYGDDLTLYELEEITNFGERKKEYEWMAKYKSNIRGEGYNYKDHIAPHYCKK